MDSFQPSEAVARYARELLDDRRVRLILPGPDPVDPFAMTPAGAYVLGREADYQVWFQPEGVTCECWAGSDHAPGPPKCGHAVAAMIAWEEYQGG